MALALAGCGDGDARTPDAGTQTERRLVFLHTNDEHSHLFGFSPELEDFRMTSDSGIRGGAARRSTLLGELRSAATGQGHDVLTVSAGDMTQGALPQVAFTTTAPDLVLMKRLGYDIIIPGNHEFDLGPKAFADSIKAAMARGGIPQMVSTNIKLNGEPNLTPLFGEGTASAPIKRYHVLTTPGGLKVGFIGVMGTEASYNAPYKVPVTFSGRPQDDAAGNLEAILPFLFEDVQPVVNVLRDVEKVDIVVVVSHGGVNLVDPSQGDDYQMARNVTGIDLIIGGHSHTALTEPQLVANATDGHEVPIVQAGSYGRYVGRVEMILKPGTRPALERDAGKSRLFEIDATIARDQTILTEVLNPLIVDLESHGVEMGKSFLEAALGRIEARTVIDDPAVVGDLYFRIMGKTAFDVQNPGLTGETNILNLSTDSMMAAMDELNLPTLTALQARGNVRADIRRGMTGEMSFADLFRAFPLGSDLRDGSVGYPLVRAYIWTVELKAAFEISAGPGLVRDQLFMAPAGMRVEFDTSRAPQVLGSAADAFNPQNGRVTKIVVDADPSDGLENPTTVLFDLSRAGQEWVSPPAQLHPVVASIYLAEFAAGFGLGLKDQHGVQQTDLNTFLVKRPDGSVVREYEAFIAYIRKQAEANGGFLPTRYDMTTQEGRIPRRMVCSGPACGTD
jgi:5'-nucleotidase / UDP-sugar diphosphatase